MFGFSSSKSSSTTSLSDSRVGADNGSLAVRGGLIEEGAQNIRRSKVAQGDGILLDGISLNNGSQIDFGSDEVAMYSIDAAYESTKNALTATSDYFENVIGRVFDFTDESAKRSQETIATNNALTELIIAENVETPETKFKQFLTIAIIGGISYAALQSGILNDLVKAIK